jgi:hypothetical protein
MIKVMKEDIIDIAKQLEQSRISLEEAKHLLAELVAPKFVPVHEQTPPEMVELLAKDPDGGTIHLTQWRPGYNIFTCQDKRESSFNWEWKLI